MFNTVCSAGYNTHTDAAAAGVLSSWIKQGCSCWAAGTPTIRERGLTQTSQSVCVCEVCVSVCVCLSYVQLFFNLILLIQRHFMAPFFVIVLAVLLQLNAMYLLVLMLKLLGKYPCGKNGSTLDPVN